MVKLSQVLEFIQNADQSEIRSIKNAVAIKRSELAYDAKVSFRVGDTVGIDHKKIDPKQNFRVIKINSKNIKVEAFADPGKVGGQYTVSPSLLVKK